MADKKRSKKGKTESPVKVIVLDVLKPHKPSIVELGKAVCDSKTVVSANLSVYATDEKTESIKMIVEGSNIDFDIIERVIEDYGSVIHSIDKVIVGKEKVISVPETPMPR